MMNLTRIKTPMFMAAIAMALSVSAAACTDDDQPNTPAERLLQVTKDSNSKLDGLIDKHTVITNDTVVDILGPVYDASAEVNDEVVGWQEQPATDGYMRSELETFRIAGLELNHLLDHLAAVGFAAGSAEQCDATPTPSPNPSPTPDPSPTPNPSPGPGPTPPRTTVATSNVLLDSALGSSQYGWRYACYAGCTAVAAACAAACTALVIPPLTIASPAIVACYAACATASGACVNECSQLKCW